MSEFKIGQEIEVVVMWYDKLPVGSICIVDSMDHDAARVHLKSNPEISGNGYFHRFKPVTSKQKPAKKYSESERKKAASEVRKLQDKLKAAVDKAKESGIKVGFVNEKLGMIDIVMEFQPEQPKKRVYK